MKINALQKNYTRDNYIGFLNSFVNALKKSNCKEYFNKKTISNSVSKKAYCIGILKVTPSQSADKGSANPENGLDAKNSAWLYFFSTKNVLLIGCIGFTSRLSAWLYFAKKGV